MDVTYSMISARLTVSFQLKDLTVEERRRIFSELLLDEEANPGQAKMEPMRKHKMLVDLGDFCGWAKQ